MSREYPMFGLRMPPELREKMDFQARLNGRSLNAEIVNRLRESLRPPTAFTVQQESAGYGLNLSDAESQLLDCFRRLPVEKQLAILALFA